MPGQADHGHSKAKKRRDELLRAGEEAKWRAVEVLGVVGELVLDDTIPDVQLRIEILWQFPVRRWQRSSTGALNCATVMTALILA